MRGQGRASSAEVRNDADEQVLGGDPQTAVEDEPNQVLGEEQAHR